MNANQIKEKGNLLRKDVLNIVKKSNCGHIASSFSCAEILATLYYAPILRFKPTEPEWPNRDRFLLSKGHAATIYYCALGDLGYFPKSELDNFAQKGSGFGVHLQDSVPGAETLSGSLGAGLGIGAGMALAAKLNRETYLTFVLMGDAECYEGSVWESAIFAGSHNLNNLIAIVDRNHMSATDFTENVLRLDPLEEKFQSFGFNVVTINGHEPIQLINALENIRTRKSSKPLMIIAETVKAKGLVEVENTLLCHGYMPSGNKINEDIKQVEALSGGEV